MLSKKYCIAFSSAATSCPLSRPCSRLPQRDERRRTHSRTRPWRRTYATIAGDAAAPNNHTSHVKDDIPWSSRRLPTPYEIFNQRRNEPYSKRRFYELVKLYHPDRVAHNNSHSSICSRDVLLERYRMIIAANSILSDPVKRRAYDIYGYGWSTAPNSSPATSTSSSSSSGTYTARHRWKHTHSYRSSHWTSDPMSNATWEDWERWYREQAAGPSGASNAPWASFFTQQGRPQHPLLANKHALFSLIMIFAILGGIVNATRARSWSNARNEKAQIVHEETSRTLMETRNSTMDRSNESKDERIARFVRAREGYGEGEVDGRLLREGDADMCASGEVKDRDKPPFWQRPPER